VIPDLFSLKGKTAIVIGAGGHICSSLAKGFAMAGAHVAVADLRFEKSETVSKQINEIYPNSTLPFQVDASDKNSIFWIQE
jgi:NAD(P)-dependent dehydrogenase (short-subunit alcohol dehydrogenase family)